MNISEGNAGAKTFHNASTLKAEDRRERLTFLGLSMPAVLAILIVVFLPIFWLSSLSFYNAAGELSTENYARIFESALYRRTFVVTFQISIAVTVICILLGYPLCYLLTKVKDRTAAILMIFVLVPFWTSVLVRTYAWLVLLQRNGIINSSLMSLGIIEEPLQLAHNLTGFLHAKCIGGPALGRNSSIYDHKTTCNAPVKTNNTITSTFNPKVSLPRMHTGKRANQ